MSTSMMRDLYVRLVFSLLLTQKVVYLNNVVKLRDEAKDMYEKACKTSGKTPEQLPWPATFSLSSTTDGMTPLSLVNIAD